LLQFNHLSAQHFIVPVAMACTGLTEAEEIRMLELELSILKRKKALAEASRTLQPVHEDEPEQGSLQLLSGLKPAECKLTLESDDSRSQASTEINSEMTDIDTSSVISDLPCKYYTVVDGVVYDLQGKAQSAKWAKRMRQKEMKETAASSAGATPGAAQGTMSIAVPGSDLKAECRVQGNRKGVNKSKGKPEAPPPAGRIIATWPIVSCATVGCDVQDRWNRMFEHHEVSKPGGSGKWGDDKDPEEIMFLLVRLLHGKIMGMHTPRGAGKYHRTAPRFCPEAGK